MQSGAERRAGVVIGEQRLAEARQARPRVERTERLARQQLGIVWRELETDVEGLFHVGAPARIERFVHEAGIAPVSANLFDRQRLLVGERQLEETSRLPERFGYEPLVDAVVDHIEKADVPAGCADVGRYAGQRRLIAFAP